MKAFDLAEGNLPLGVKVYDALRSAVLNGRYRPGDHLVEEKIAGELGVSRTPVREAVRRLEMEGLVEILPNRGVIVKGLSARDLSDIFEIRILLEALAGKRAVEKITSGELRKLADCCDLMRFYTKKGDTANLTKLNAEFHEIIYGASKSPVLKHILTDFLEYIKPGRHESLSSPGRRKAALEEHLNILRALEDGNFEKLNRAICLHVKNSGAN